MKHILTLIKWCLKPFKKLRRRWILAKAYPKLKAAYEKQQKEQIELKKSIMVWLREYFGIDARSKFIPKDFKNKSEVEIAVMKKFGDRMNKLSLGYNELFK